MQESPLISIVLPTFNGARYLRESIESCIQQTYTNWELIVVDDASTDHTPAIIAEYVANDPRIRAIRNADNKKLPASLNAGFAEARGEYVTWTSDDNCYRPEALFEMLSYLVQNCSVDFVYSDFSLIDDSGDSAGLGWAAPPEKLAFDSCVGACFLYRRIVAEEVGKYAEDLFLVEDYDYWLRVAARFQLA